MRAILDAAKASLEFRFRSRASLELEIVALRHQLSAIKRKRKVRVELGPMDRFFWVLLYRVWPKILEQLVIVKPDTVVKWHYAGFRLFWRYRSKGGKSGMKPIKAEIRDLIYQMKRDNALWGRQRIASELEKIGYTVSPITVGNYLRRGAYAGPSGPSSPSWKAFFANHIKECAAVDFFVVVTFGFQLLYGMVVLNLSRRKIIHFAVSAHPKQEWVTNELRHCFTHFPKPKFIIRDRDSIYGHCVQEYFASREIQEVVVTKPWQNGHVESLIRAIRMECLDHVVIFNERHLRRTLASYVNYYNFSRTHFHGLDGDCPVHRPIERPIKGKKIVAISQVGGLHHRYERRAA